MRHLLYFLAPSLAFKVSCHFALSLQTNRRFFAFLNWEMADGVFTLRYAYLFHLISLADISMPFPSRNQVILYASLP